MTMSKGYPAQADIDDFFSDLGLELISDNNVNFETEEKQWMWGILQRLKCLLSLAVYAVTTTTFNVAGGRYDYNGTVKTYTAGAAVNPTDNDTTYVWMNADNTIGSAIDGTGWPATEHIKLAEIDVDADGVITDIRDMRTVTFSVTAAA